jgi:hypothetical protein
LGDRTIEAEGLVIGDGDQVDIRLPSRKHNRAWVVPFRVDVEVYLVPTVSRRPALKQFP